MALSFTDGSSNQVAHGVAGSAINQLNQWSWCGWIKFNTLTAFNNIMGDPGGSSKLIFLVSATDVSGYIGRATGSAQYDANNGSLVTGTWYFLAVTADISAAAGSLIHIYLGTLTSIAAELTYSSKTDGSGAVTTSTNPYIIGSQSANTSAGFSLAWHGLWNRVLSIGEIRQQQFFQFITSGCVLFTHYGFQAGASASQPDLSASNLPGTVTGAAIANHAPINGIIVPAEPKMMRRTPFRMGFDAHTCEFNTLSLG